MRKTLIRWLLALVRWLIGDDGVVVLIVSPVSLVKARDATRLAEARFGPRFGSAKRRDALAILMKQGLSEADAALAIELVLQ